MQYLQTKNLIMISPLGINFLFRFSRLLEGASGRERRKLGVENKMNAILRLTLSVVEVESYKFVLIKISLQTLWLLLHKLLWEIFYYFFLMNRFLPFINEQDFL
ncbi:hypothetical protein ACKWTF_012662 [Chironomus riparius]